MGYIRHDAVVAVTADYSGISRENTTELVANFRLTMPEQYQKFLVGPVRGMNGDDMWCFLPDGSKEGWDYSDEVEVWRNKFRDLLRENVPTEYVALSFGGDLEDGSFITEDSQLLPESRWG